LDPADFMDSRATRHPGEAQSDTTTRKEVMMPWASTHHRGPGEAKHRISTIEFLEVHGRRETMRARTGLVALVVVASLGVAIANGTSQVTVTKTADPTTIWKKGSGYMPDTTTITLEVTGFGGTKTETLPIDVVYGIDSSGSMGYYDPSGLRKVAAKSFTDKLDSTQDTAGIVSWDNNIDFTYGLSNNFSYLKSRIDAVDSSGGTSLNAGLYSCIAMLNANTRTETSVEVIIFLTDGYGSYTDAANGGPAATAASKGYTIYSIGLGSAAPGPLQDMASATGGTYYSSPSAANLQAIFDAIFTEVIISTAPYDVDLCEVTHDYIVDEGSFSIAPDNITNVGGKTKMEWLDVAQYTGDDARLTADETFTVTFTAKSSKCGYKLPVDASGSKVSYLDPDGSSQSVSVPQAYITVGCRVKIDLKPGSYPNSIRLGNPGVVPVAVLTTACFDATTIDPDSVEFAGAYPLRSTTEDVDDDGDDDMLFHFARLDLELYGSSTEATLTGETEGGVPIQGTDTVRIVPKKNK
jgi:Ca-activated chloride channel family protein